METPIVGLWVHRFRDGASWIMQQFDARCNWLYTDDDGAARGARYVVKGSTLVLQGSDAALEFRYKIKGDTMNLDNRAYKRANKAEESLFTQSLMRAKH